MAINISIKSKLSLSFTVVLLLFILGIWGSLRGVLSIGSQFEGFLANNYVRLTAYQTMFSDGLLSGIALRNLLLKPHMNKPYSVVPESIERFDKAYQVVQKLAASDPKILEALTEIDQHWQKTREAKLRVLELMKAGDKETATEVLTKEEHPHWQKVRIAVQKLVITEEASIDRLRKSLIAEKRTSLLSSVLLAAIAISVCAVIALLSIRSINKAFCHVIQSLNDIASGDGDLTQRLDESGRDEVALLSAAFNRFVEKIHQLVKQVAETSHQLTDSAKVMSDNSVETKLNLNQQESEIEKVAAAINEMATTVQEVSRHAASASSAAQSADEGSSNGYQVVSQVIAAINDLAGEVQQITLTISQLRDDSQKIGSVLDVIKDIAEQTNLLALNAAIEAARAGEQGRGFAVVADEVRTLASRTQKSTQEIQQMIEHLQEGAINATVAIDRGQDKTQTTVDKAQIAGKALTDITHAVSKIAEMNTQIATAAEEQTAVAEEINRNVSAIRTLSGKTATGAEYTAASSQELQQVAEQLQSMISSFRV